MAPPFKKKARSRVTADASGKDIQKTRRCFTAGEA